MNEAKRRAAEALGYRFGDAADFLGLTDEERRLVELRVAVGIATRNLRQAAEMTQATLAERVGSSPSRVNKVEHGLPGVSIDLAFKALFAAGGSIADLVGKEASSVLSAATPSASVSARHVAGRGIRTMLANDKSGDK